MSANASITANGRRLAWAVARNDLSLLKFLLGGRASQEVLDNCLMTACKRGLEEMVEYVLSAGANPRAVLPKGENALIFVGVPASWRCPGQPRAPWKAFSL
jgi:hypothetical protein